MARIRQKRALSGAALAISTPPTIVTHTSLIVGVMPFTDARGKTINRPLSLPEQHDRVDVLVPKAGRRQRLPACRIRRRTIVIEYDLDSARSPLGRDSLLSFVFAIGPP